MKLNQWQWGLAIAAVLGAGWYLSGGLESFAATGAPMQNKGNDGPDYQPLDQTIANPRPTPEAKTGVYGPQGLDTPQTGVDVNAIAHLAEYGTGDSEL